MNGVGYHKSRKGGRGRRGSLAQKRGNRGKSVSRSSKGLSLRFGKFESAILAMTLRPGKQLEPVSSTGLSTYPAYSYRSLWRIQRVIWRSSRDFHHTFLYHLRWYKNRRSRQFGPAA